MSGAPSANGFQWILCDLGGVVVHVDSARAVQELATLARCSVKDVIALLDTELLAAFEEGRVTPQQFFEGLARPLQLAMTYDAFVALWNNLFTENAETAALLERLRPQCHLAALSNTNELHFNHLMASVPSMRLFHRYLPSFQLGMRKPQPQFYLTALERMGATPWGTVYIDDREDLVAAGRALGLKAIRFSDAKHLRTELHALGFDV